jgi:hypothetical protein
MTVEVCGAEKVLKTDAGITLGGDGARGAV